MVYVIFLTHSSRIPLHHTHATSRFWFQQQCSVSSWFQKFVFILNDYKYRLNSEIQSFDISYILSQVTIIIQIFESSLFVKGLNESSQIWKISPGTQDVDTISPDQFWPVLTLKASPGTQDLNTISPDQFWPVFILKASLDKFWSLRTSPGQDLNRWLTSAGADATKANEK